MTCADHRRINRYCSILRSVVQTYSNHSLRMCVCVCVCAEVCLLKKDAGGCGNYEPVWYFEPVTGVCRRFLYGGCGGNANRFETAEACWERCGDSPHLSSTLTPRPTSSDVHYQSHGKFQQLKYTGVNNFAVKVSSDLCTLYYYLICFTSCPTIWPHDFILTPQTSPHMLESAFPIE